MVVQDPQGTNGRANPYYARANHKKLPREEENRTEFLTGAAAAPVITGVPVISGTEQVGETLTASRASVTGNPTPTPTGQWVNSVSGDIPGAVSNTYVLQASDEGDTITFRQIETNTEGSDTATSNPTGVIQPSSSAAVLSGLSLSAQVAGDVSLTYTIDKTSNVTGVWTSSNTKPTAAQVNAGTATDQIGSNFTELFDGSAVNTPLPSGHGGTAYLWLVPATGTVVYPVAGNINTSFDTVVPTLDTKSPLDGATGIAVGSNIVATFSKDMAAVGTITLRIVGGAAVETFTLSAGTGDNGGTVVLGGTGTEQITLNPGADLSNSEDYCIRTSGLKDSGEHNSFPDITNDTDWNFTTEQAAGDTPDTFDEMAAETTLENYVGASGKSWLRNRGSIGESKLGANDRLYGDSIASDTKFEYTETQQTDHYVKATFVHGSNASQTGFSMGIQARAEVQNDSRAGYLARYDFANSRWELRQQNSGSGFIDIGNWSDTWGAGDTRVVEVRCVGTTISLIIDGTTRVSETNTAFTQGVGAVYWVSGTGAANGVHVEIDDFVSGVPS